MRMVLRVKVEKQKLSSKWRMRVKETVNIRGFYVPFTAWNDFKSAILKTNNNKTIEEVHRFFGELQAFNRKKELPIHYKKPFAFQWILI